VQVFLGDEAGRGSEGEWNKGYAKSSLKAFLQESKRDSRGKLPECRHCKRARESIDCPLRKTKQSGKMPLYPSIMKLSSK